MTEKQPYEAPKLIKFNSEERELTLEFIGKVLIFGYLSRFERIMKARKGGTFKEKTEIEEIHESLEEIAQSGNGEG